MKTNVGILLCLFFYIAREVALMAAPFVDRHRPVQWIALCVVLAVGWVLDMRRKPLILLATLLVLDALAFALPVYWVQDGVALRLPLQASVRIAGILLAGCCTVGILRSSTDSILGRCDCGGVEGSGACGHR